MSPRKRRLGWGTSWVWPVPMCAKRSPSTSCSTPNRWAGASFGSALVFPAFCGVAGICWVESRRNCRFAPARPPRVKRSPSQKSSVCALAKCRPWHSWTRPLSGLSRERPQTSCFGPRWKIPRTEILCRNLHLSSPPMGRCSPHASRSRTGSGCKTTWRTMDMRRPGRFSPP